MKYIIISNAHIVFHFKSTSGGNPFVQTVRGAIETYREPRIREKYNSKGNIVRNFENNHNLNKIIS